MGDDIICRFGKPINNCDDSNDLPFVVVLIAFVVFYLVVM